MATPDSTPKQTSQKVGTIYALIDPRNDEIRYVGQTYQTPQARLRNHLSASKRGVRTHVACWLRGLILNGFKPIMVELEIIQGNGNDAEKQWIAYGYNNQWRLTNHTIGGDGNLGNKSSVITKQRISAAHKTRFKDPALRQERSAAVKAQWANPEIRERRLAGLRESIASDEWIKNNRQSQLDRWAKPDAREKHSQTMKQALSSDEARMKMSKAASAITGESRSNALKKRYENPEARVKTGTASKALWEDPDYRAKQSKSRKATWDDPEYRKRMSEIRKRSWITRKAKKSDS